MVERVQSYWLIAFNVFIYASGKSLLMWSGMDLQIKEKTHIRDTNNEWMNEWMNTFIKLSDWNSSK